jgi:hypothetical protein
VSRIYFHSEHGRAEVNGSERAWLGLLCKNLAFGLLDTDADRVLPLVAPGHYLHEQNRTDLGWGLRWDRMLKTALHCDSDTGELLAWRGRRLNTLGIYLNTAILVGSDSVKLAARIDGQCEIHAFVEGKNRTWFADLVDRALEDGVFRRGLWFKPHLNTPAGAEVWHEQGWDDVTKLLRSRDDGPVVMSYSVCDGFPNRMATDVPKPTMPDDWQREGWSAEEWADLDDGERAEYWQEQVDEQWSSQPESVQWEQAMAGLRSSWKLLEIKPETFGTYRFDEGLTVLDLNAADRDARLERAYADA